MEQFPWDMDVRWDCRDAKDIARLKNWTIAQLDRGPTRAELERDLEIDNDEQFWLEQSRYFGAILKRGQVRLAAKEQNYKELERLSGNDPDLRALGYRELSRKHSVGREKGEARPRDLPYVLRIVLMDAHTEVEKIKKLWKQKFGTT